MSTATIAPDVRAEEQSKSVDDKEPLIKLIAEQLGLESPSYLRSYQKCLEDHQQQYEMPSDLQVWIKHCKKLEQLADDCV